MKAMPAAEAEPRGRPVGKAQKGGSAPQIPASFSVDQIEDAVKKKIAQIEQSAAHAKD